MIEGFGDLEPLEKARAGLRVVIQSTYDMHQLGKYFLRPEAGNDGAIRFVPRAELTRTYPRDEARAVQYMLSPLA